MKTTIRYRVHMMLPDGRIAVKVIRTGSEVEELRNNYAVMQVVKINEVGAVIG